MLNLIGDSKVEIILGPYRSGKTHALLKRLVAEANFPQGAILLVPSARYRTLVEAKIKSLLKSAQASVPSGIFGLRIMSLNQLCRYLLTFAGVQSRTVTQEVRLAVVANVLDELAQQGELSGLMPIAKLAGTQRAILELIDEFERCGISPESVCEKLAETASSHSSFIELSKVYRYYWQRVDHAGFQDERRLSFMARELIFNNRLGGLDLGLLAVDGFDRFTHIQAELISGLSFYARETIVLFDYLYPDNSSNQWFLEYRWKESSFDELIATLAPSKISLVDRGFSQPREVIVISVLDRFHEMEEIARRIKESLVRDKVKPSEILVTARNLRVYRGAIEMAFESAGVPYFIDENIGLKELPATQFILRLLRLDVDDFPRAEVVSCLRSPFCNLSSLKLSDALLNTIDEASIEESLLGGRARWLKFLHERMPGHIKDALERFFACIYPGAADRTYIEHCSWLEDLIDKFFCLPKIDLASNNSSAFDARHALAGVRKVVANLVLEETILGQRKISFGEFVERFENAVEAANFRRQKGNCEVVTVCGADIAPNQMFEEVFIAGLTEGEFPRSSIRSGFVTSENVSRWISFGINIENPRNHPGFEEALFASLLGRAKQRASCFYPSYEMSGEEALPSVLVSRLKSQGVEVVNLARPFSSSLKYPVSCRDGAQGLLSSKGGASLLSQLEGDGGVSLYLKNISSSVAIAQGRAYGLRDSLYNGRLVDLVGCGALKVPLPELFSISGLNDYGKCPFRYWVSRVLKVEPIEDIEAGLNSILRGQVAHRALELFYKRIVSEGLSTRTSGADELRSILEMATEEALLELEQNSRFTSSEFWQYEKMEIKLRLVRFLHSEIERSKKDDEGYEPKMFEVPFGCEDVSGSFPPLAIEYGGRKVLIRGVVDRVDIKNGAVSPGRLKVIDYKYGSSDISQDDARQGRNMQIPVYALALERVVLPHCRSSKGAYLSISSGDEIGRLDFESEAHLDLFDSTERLIVDFVNRIDSGDYVVRPSNSSVCRQCSHAPVCRIEELNQLEVDDESVD